MEVEEIPSVEEVMQRFCDAFPTALLSINTSNTDPRPFSKLEFQDRCVDEIDGLTSVEVNLPLSQFGMFVRLLEGRQISSDLVDLSEYRGNSTPLLLSGCGCLAVLENGDYLHYKDTVFEVTDANRLRTWCIFCGIISPIKVQSGNVLSDHHSLLYDELGEDPLPSIFRLMVAHVLPKSFFVEISKERKNQVGDNTSEAYKLLIARAVNILRLIWTRKSILMDQTLPLALFNNEPDRDTVPIDEKCSTESLQSLRSALLELIECDEKGNPKKLLLLDAAFPEPTDAKFKTARKLVKNKWKDVCIALQYQLILMLDRDAPAEFPNRLDLKIKRLVNSDTLPSLPESLDVIDITFWVHQSDSAITGTYLFMLMTLFGASTFKSCLQSLFADNLNKHHQSIRSILVDTLSQFVHIAHLMFNSFDYDEAIEFFRGNSDGEKLLEKHQHKPGFLSQEDTQTLKKLEQFKDMPDELLILPASHSPATSTAWGPAKTVALTNALALLQDLTKIGYLNEMDGEQQRYQFTFFKLRLMEVIVPPSVHCNKKQNRGNLEKLQDAIDHGLLHVAKSLNRVNENMGKMATTLLRHAEEINKDIGDDVNDNELMSNLVSRFTNGLKHHVDISSNKIQTYGVNQFEFSVKEREDRKEKDGVFRSLHKEKTTPGDIDGYAYEQSRTIASGAMQSMTTNHLKRVCSTMIRMVKYLHGKSTKSSTFATKKQIQALLPKSVAGTTPTDNGENEDDPKDDPISYAENDQDSVDDDDNDEDYVDDDDNDEDYVDDDDDDQDTDRENNTDAKQKKFADKVRATEWGGTCVQIFDSLKELSGFSLMLHLLVRMQHCIEIYGLHSRFSISRFCPEFSPLNTRHLNMTRAFIGFHHDLVTAILQSSRSGRGLHKWALEVLNTDEIEDEVTGATYINIICNTIALDMAEGGSKFGKLFGEQTRAAFIYMMKHDAHGLHCVRKFGNLKWNTLSEIQSIWNGKTKCRGMIRKALVASSSTPYPFHLGLLFDVGKMLKFDQPRSTQATASRWDGIVCFAPNEARARVRRQRSIKQCQTAYCSDTRGIDTEAIWLGEAEQLLLWQLDRRYRLSQSDGTPKKQAVVARQVVAELQQLSRCPSDDLNGLDPQNSTWTNAVTSFVTHIRTLTNLEKGNGSAGRGSAGKAYFAGNAKPLLEPNPVFVDEKFMIDFDDWLRNDSLDSIEWIGSFPDLPEEWEKKRNAAATLLRDDMVTFARDPGLFEEPVEILFLPEPKVQFDESKEAIGVQMANAKPLDWQHLVDEDVKQQHKVAELTALRSKVKKELNPDFEDIEITKSTFLDRRAQRQDDYDRIIEKRKKDQTAVIDLGIEKRKLNRSLKNVDLHNAGLFSKPRNDKLIAKRMAVLRDEDLDEDLASLSLGELKGEVDETVFKAVAEMVVHSVIVSGNCSGFKTYGGLSDLIQRTNTCFTVLEHQSTKRCFCGEISSFHWSSFTPGIGRPRRTKYCNHCGRVIDRDISAACIQFFEFVGKLFSTPFLSHGLLTCERYGDVLSRLNGMKLDKANWESTLVRLWTGKRDISEVNNGTGEDGDSLVHVEDGERTEGDTESGSRGNLGRNLRGKKQTGYRKRSNKKRKTSHKVQKGNQNNQDDMMIAEERPSNDVTMQVEQTQQVYNTGSSAI